MPSWIILENALQILPRSKTGSETALLHHSVLTQLLLRVEHQFKPWATKICGHELSFHRGLFSIFKKRRILNLYAFIQLLSILLTLPTQTFRYLKIRFLLATPSLLPWTNFSIHLASACALANDVKPSADALKAYPGPGW